MADRREPVRRLDHSSEDRRFSERQVTQLLAEVVVRGRGHTVNRLTARLAEVDLVEVGLEDLVLGVAFFEGKRERGFANLAQWRALLGQEKILGELPRDRAAALSDRAMADVRDQRTTDAAEVEPLVLVEAL